MSICLFLSAEKLNDFIYSCIAGGYDAIWLLVCDPVETSPDIRPLERVEYVWSEYTALNVSPLSVVESLAGGTRVEDLDAIQGLKKAIGLE